nr:plant intracellular Ras-group-related LRR protein 7 isoform X4 [Setaria viridis]
MGCCSSRSSDSPASRATRWRSTGIVALRDARLKELPNEVLQVGNSLRTLDLTNNKLVGSLSNLQQLSISHNSLMCLPKSVGDLRNMLILNVSDNKLKELPESIGGCNSLEELQANGPSTWRTNPEAKYPGNSIEDVPSSICNLVCLKSLSLNGNKIRQLPENILKDCTALQNLSLHDNPIMRDQFQQMEGFNEFEARRRKKFDKQIDSRVMLGSTALDEGVDFH